MREFCKTKRFQSSFFYCKCCKMFRLDFNAFRYFQFFSCNFFKCFFNPNFCKNSVIQPFGCNGILIKYLSIYLNALFQGCFRFTSKTSTVRNFLLRSKCFSSKLNLSTEAELPILHFGNTQVS